MLCFCCIACFNMSSTSAIFYLCAMVVRNMYIYLFQTFEGAVPSRSC